MTAVITLITVMLGTANDDNDGNNNNNVEDKKNTVDTNNTATSDWNVDDLQLLEDTSLFC